MQQTDLPARFPIPFANNAGGAYIRAIPEPHQAATSSDAPASLYDGFPAETFLPQASGGIPPNGADFNGLFNQLTAQARWSQAGGPAIFDATFATKIGGYPKGAQLISTVTPGLIWISTADNNLTNPDGGSPANWTAIRPPISSSNLVSNNGYRIHSDGFIETWGTISVPSGSTVTVPLIVPHTSWFNVALAPFVKHDTGADHNLGIYSKNGLASFTLANWDSVMLSADWSTRGK